MQQLFDLASDLNDSASNEGCEADLMVVGAAQLWDLLQHITKLKAGVQPLEVNGPTDAENICERLLNSEEHAGEAAIPQVAEEAAEIIHRLSTGLHATQVALSQAMQHSEKAGKLVEQIAGLYIWGYDKNDGTPYKECEEPGDGYLDSHCCLMGCVEEARNILAM